jgi:glycosylphosphatidylinositol transamidase (GPIT) subunit GPI8
VDPKAGPDSERADLWALVVAGSSGWENYRHQADALAQYRLLRANGVPDDRIILVLADDLATAPQNRYPGVPYQPEGADLNTPAPEVDYPLANITATDLLNILAGNASERLPRVIQARADHNVYVFLSGHGSRDGFFVNSGDALAVGNGSLLKPAELNATLQAMAGRYRQVLLTVESCHAGALGEALTAPNALLLAAANPYENSLAHNRRIEDGTWLANRFAFELWRAAADQPEQSLVHLYERLYGRVNGSHVSLYNAANFDGEVTVTVGSFLSYPGLGP